MNQTEETEIIGNDCNELSDLELIIVLLGIGWQKPTRMHRVIELYGLLYDPDIVESGSFEESVANLIDIGVLTIRKPSDEIGLTTYGSKLCLYLWKEYDENVIDNLYNIDKSVRAIPDKNLVGIIMHYYFESKDNAVSKQISKLNAKCTIDGISLEKYPLGIFEENLRIGKPIDFQSA